MLDHPKRIAIASDHGGLESKVFMAEMLREAQYEVLDFGNSQSNTDDDHPDYVPPVTRAVAGSGVDACIAANKVHGVRACLIHEGFSAHQGVEDDNMNVICLGGRVVANTFAWELVKAFLAARFSGAERHQRRIAKVAMQERGQAAS